MSEFDWQMTFLTITGAAASLFPIIYTVFAPWWRSQVGRALVVSDISLAALVDLSLLGYWFGWHFSEHVSTAVVALIAIAALLRCWAVIDVQVIKQRAHRGNS